MSLEKRLINIISETLGVEEKKVFPDSDFYSDFNTGRLELIDLIMTCQKKLNINLDENAINKVRTVAGLLKLLEENSDEI